MIEFSVPDMTCGHCASAITQAVKALDPTAKVEISLEAHRVRVETKAAAEALERAIREAGYSPVAA
ncbi:MAG: heavy-metal-associated domain-containing protein [Burkholderiales bacterium]|nr:heavy-metal-associated domain-containing protein [Burkholderiales bacterium]